MEETCREQVLTWAQRVLDGTAFNRLVVSAPQTRARGRLRFWQEEVLARIRRETGVAITTAAEFAAIFERVPERELPPPTREEFLADPLGRLSPDADPAWIVKAYRAGGRFREHVIDCIARSVSKTGNMGQATYWIRTLGGRLERAEAVQLYECVRDRSARLEFEWRPEFEKSFPAAAGSLPPRQDGWYNPNEQAEP